MKTLIVTITIFLILTLFFPCFAQEQTKRIISTYHPANSLIFGLDAQKNLVGVSKGADRLPLFREILPEMSKLPQVGSRQSGINIETVVSLEPDLVILPPSVTGKEESKRLEDLGFSTLVLDLETLNDFYISLKALGRQLNKSEEAEKLIKNFDEILSIVDTHLVNIDYRPKCYYASQRNFLNTVSADLLQGVMIQRAGGINVAAELNGDNRTITAEQLLLWNPDIIFISYNSPESYETLAASPVYANVNAVKNKQVYRFPSEISPWDYPSIEIFPAILWLSTKIHPQKYENFDFLKILDEFYISVYGKSFTDFGGKLDE